MRRNLPASFLAVLALAVVAAHDPIATGSPRTVDDRIVAIGDVHGAYDELVAVLRAADLIDDGLAWTGDAATLVQTGDLLDRGAEVRRVMDLLMRLQAEAPATDGRVIVLMGNHDAMNLLGDLRYVTPEIYATFAGDDAEDLRLQAYREYERRVLRPDPDFRRASPAQRRWARSSWLEDHPQGFVEYQRAMAPSGTYGAWLRTLPLATVIDGVLFMHASLDPALADIGIEGLNQRIADEVATLDRYREVLVREGLITEFAEVDEIIRGAARATGGLDWLPEFDGDVRAPPPLPDGPLDGIDDARERFLPLLRLDEWFLLAPEGPLWFRGLAQWDEEEASRAVDEVLATLGLRAIVGGHTTQRQGIRTRFDGRLILIDTGMNPTAYGGRPAALEISVAGVEALYASGESEMLEVAWQRAGAVSTR